MAETSAETLQQISEARHSAREANRHCDALDLELKKLKDTVYGNGRQGLVEEAGRNSEIVKALTDRLRRLENEVSTVKAASNKRVAEQQRADRLAFLQVLGWVVVLASVVLSHFLG